MEAVLLFSVDVPVEVNGDWRAICWLSVKMDVVSVSRKWLKTCFRNEID